MRESEKKGEILKMDGAGAIIDANNVNNIQLASLSADSLKYFSEEEQKEIMELANVIDVTDRAKIMEYASPVTREAVKGKMEFLEKMIGEPEDEEIMKHIAELSSKAENEISQLQIASKKGGLFGKLFSKLFSAKEVSKKINDCATLLEELGKIMDKRVETCEKMYEYAEDHVKKDSKVVHQLSKYIVAGYIAEERIEKEIEELKSKDPNSLVGDDFVNLQLTETGLENFKLILDNRENARAVAAFSIACGTSSMKHFNLCQIKYASTKDTVMYTFGQNAGNAILAKKADEMIDGYRGITQLNETLMKETAEQGAKNFVSVAKLLTKGDVDPKLIKDCVMKLVDGLNEGQRILLDNSASLESKKVEYGESIKAVNNLLTSNSMSDNKSVSSIENIKKSYSNPNGSSAR